MKQSHLFTRLAAIVGGAIVYCLALAINEIGTDVFTDHLQMAGHWAHWSENWPLVVDYDRIAGIFYWGYPACVGLMATFIFWNGWPSEGARLIIYLLILGVIGPLTYINYLQSDQWVNLWTQSIFNLFVAFCGYSAVITIRNIRVTAADALALQSLTVLMITSLLVALPLFYTGIFLAVAFKLMDHQQVQLINKHVPLAVAGAAGIVAVLLTNLDKLRSAKSGSSE
ncbi:MAG: hypothetical protein ABSE80_11935 [Halobacteriota archaeon]